MSYSSHRKAVRDASLPFPHRASHLRSCALHIANKLAVSRDAVIETVKSTTGIDLHAPEDVGALERALAALEDMRMHQVD
jgi:hypothetical protein